MDDAKSVGTPLVFHFRLSKDQSHVIEEKMAYMDNVPYASVIGNPMYVTMCTRQALQMQCELSTCL